MPYAFLSLFSHAFTLDLHRSVHLCFLQSVCAYMLEHAVGLRGRPGFGKRARRGFRGMCVLCYVVVRDPWNTFENCQKPLWIVVLCWPQCVNSRCTLQIALRGQVMACRGIAETSRNDTDLVASRCSGNTSGPNRKHWGFLFLRKGSTSSPQKPVPNTIWLWKFSFTFFH